MSIRKTASAILLTASALFLTLASPTHAAVLTYTEVIEDIAGPATPFCFANPLDFCRDLQRTRALGDGTVLVEDLDATIIGDNLVTDNWGVTTFLPFSLSHIFLADSVTSFLSATLTLEVIGVDGSILDFLFVDFPLPLGVLTPGVGEDGPSTTVLSTAIIPDPTLIDGVLSFLLADGTLSVAAFPLLLDLMSIRSSTLSVTYESVPEPAAGLLMLGSLLALGGRGVIRRCRN